MIVLTVGRESGVEAPRLSVTCQGKTYHFGTPGSVPKSVSRNHCKVVIGEDGGMQIEDITSNNFMFVNGKECKRRGNISVNDTIELGPDKFRLDLGSITKALATQLAFHIKGLQEVYDKYQSDRMAAQMKQGRLNAISMIPGIISAMSVVLMTVFWNQGGTAIRIAMGSLAVIGMGVFAIIRFKNASKIPLENKAMEDKFREQGVRSSGARA